jgi:hypothetical protein
LIEPPFERNRCGEEQGVQWRTVEAFADVGASGGDQQGCSAGLNVETGKGGISGFGSHAATVIATR